MTTQRSILVALFLLAAFAAHAQSFCSFAPYGNTDQTLSYLDAGPPFGFQAWTCTNPAKGWYQQWPLTRQWTWVSTCPQGGIIVQTVTITGMDTQINVDSLIADPVTGRGLGFYRGFGYVDPGTNLPAFIPTKDTGGPCYVGPLQSQNQEGVTEQQ